MRSSIKKIVSLLLALCAVVSMGCEKEEWKPYYVLWLTARVVDEAGNPIQGIVAYPEGAEFCGRTGYSDYKGVIDAFAHLKPGQERVIIFEDIDGYYNGGCYQSLRLDISDRIPPYSNTPDEWGYVGDSFVKLGDIVLHKTE